MQNILKRFDFKNLFTKAGLIKVGKALIPFAILLIASFLPFSIYFKGAGINGGDDALWHVIYIYDYAYGLEHGFRGIGPNHNFLGNLAHNTYLFYAPLVHIFVAVLYECFKGVGATIVGTMKFVTIASVFLSGVWTYLLAMKITKGDKFISILAGIIYIFSPYRIFNFMYRQAFNEGVAQGFFPLFFLGLYTILHDEKYKVSAYMATLLSSVILILTHPFTALTAATAGVVLILVNFKSFKRIFTSKAHLISIACSAILMVGLIGFYVFPMMLARRTGYYRLTNEVIMWTNVEHLIKDQSKSLTFSGLINFKWIDSWPKITYGESSLTWSLDIVFFLFFGAGSTLALVLCSKKDKQLIGFVISLLIALCTLLFSRREEVIMAVVALIMCLSVFTLFEKPVTADEFHREEVKSTFKNLEIYVCVGLIVLIMLALFMPSMWYAIPSIYRQAQFPFRFWGIFWFIVVFLLLIAAKPLFKSQYFKGALIVAATALLIVSQGPMDKRIAMWNGQSLYEESQIVTKLHNVGQIGVQNEYVPQVFYETGYKSKYSNSLYKIVSTQLKNKKASGFDWGIEKYRTPVFLEGSGTMTITYLNSPCARFDCTITSEKALIQIPQFYYDGYEITYNSKTDNKSYKVKGKYVDGLLAFDGYQGEYVVTVNYVGSTAYRIFRPIFYISILGTVAFGVLGTYFSHRTKKDKKKKDESLEDSSI